MIVEDDLFQELLDRMATLERKFAIIEQCLTPKEAAGIADRTPTISRDENERRSQEDDQAAHQTFLRSAAPSETPLPIGPVSDRLPSPLLHKEHSAMAERRGH